MKTKYLTSLMLLVVACSGGQTTGGEPAGESTAKLKQAAAEAKASGAPAPGDVCAQRGWYGDTECDTFCQDFDSQDCTPPSTGDGVVCAAFIEEADGECKRAPTDPCISQDPDCSNSVDPDPGQANPGQVEPSPPLVCTAISQLPDGVCKPDANDPCVFYQDPDCQSGGGEPGNPGGNPPSDPNPPGGSEPSPPDGPICLTYVEESDGVCSREPTDPCISQDPDCVAK